MPYCKGNRVVGNDTCHPLMWRKTAFCVPCANHSGKVISRFATDICQFIFGYLPIHIRLHRFLCSVLLRSNAAVPVLPPWNSEHNDTNTEEEAMDDDDDDSVQPSHSIDLVEWVDRVRQLLQASCRPYQKKKKPPKLATSKKRVSLTDMSTAASATAAAERIRPLSAAGTTMTPGEIIGAILTSVGVGTAGGGPLRRRSTSSPEAAFAASSASTSEEIKEEDESDNRE